MESKDIYNLHEAYMEVYAQPKNEFEYWIDSLLEEGYDLSDYTWDEMYEFYLDEAEGSYGQTPKATQAYGELASRRRKTPASELKGGKGKSVRSAQKHYSRTQDPDAGNRGKKSSRGSGGRRGMTQSYRDYARGESEYGHVGYDPGHHGGPSAPGSKPKGKKLERQRKTGVSESYDLYDIILSHLLDEGYAETPEAAEVIMVNMSEDWRDDIMEALEKEFKSMRKRGGRSAPLEQRTGTRDSRDYWADVLGKNRDRGKGNRARRRAGKEVQAQYRPEPDLSRF